MSIISIRLGEKSFRVDSNKGFDLSIPFRFQGDSLSAFGLSPTSLQTVETDDFIGDTQRDGSCNVNQYTLIPHSHGTHTECVGHIVNDDITITETLKDVWMPAIILTVKTEKARCCPDSYASSNQEENDEIISKQRLMKGLQQFDDKDFLHALIIRTLPNDDSKKTRHYSHAPYFSNEAMEVIAHRSIQHLLVDLPSVDRMKDQGRLSNHRIFWGIATDCHDLNGATASSKTITELIFIADEIKDGYYLLNLQIAHFMADAAPSRPVVFQELTL